MKQTARHSAISLYLLLICCSVEFFASFFIHSVFAAIQIFLIKNQDINEIHDIWADGSFDFSDILFRIR